MKTDMVLFIDEIKEFIEKYTIEINGVKYIALSDIEKALDIPPQKIKEPKRKKCKTHERHTKVVYSTKENETYSSIQLVFKHTTCLGYQRWQSQLFHNVIQHHRQKLLHHTIMSTQTYQVMTSSMSFIVHILL